jgi:CSLREA domain-containing protein
MPDVSLSKQSARLSVAVAAMAILVAFGFVAQPSPWGVLPAVAANIQVNTEEDASPSEDDGDCSLREAIENAEADSVVWDDCLGGTAGVMDQITFAGNVQEIVLAQNLPDIDDGDGLTIDGGGTVTIDGDDLYQMFEVNSPATLVLTGLVLTDASTTGSGAAINNESVTDVLESTITSSSADDTGGAIYNTGSLTLVDSTVSGNSASDDGGGIENDEGEMFISGSTISGNTAGDDGGGIDNDDGPVVIVNSTISGNTANGESGGIENEGPAGELTVINSTITRNRDFDATDGLAGGIRNEDDGSVRLVNTIVADQLGGADCVNEDSSSWVSLGNNLDSDGSCLLTGPGDLPNGSADLASLDDNGGPTATHALREDSDAADAGNDEVCQGDPVEGVDQRGVTRPVGPACDIGSFETTFVTPTPTPTATPVTVSAVPTPRPNIGPGIAGPLAAAAAAARENQERAGATPQAPSSGIRPPSTGDAGMR